MRELLEGEQAGWHKRWATVDAVLLPARHCRAAG